MSGLETKELEELEQKNAPETVNTVTTSGTKRKRTRRPKLIWVMGEKMRADDPRRDAPFMDDEDITDDIQDWEPAKLEFHLRRLCFDLRRHPHFLRWCLWECVDVRFCLTWSAIAEAGLPANGDAHSSVRRNSNFQRHVA